MGGEDQEEGQGAACSGDSLGAGKRLEGMYVLSVLPSGEVSVAGTVVLEQPTSGLLGGLLKTGCWVPSSLFLDLCIWRGPCKAHF